MLAYGYEVDGCKEALDDISELLQDSAYRVNWSKFIKGESYYTQKCRRLIIKEIDHKNKHVTIENI